LCMYFRCKQLRTFPFRIAGKKITKGSVFKDTSLILNQIKLNYYYNGKG